MHTEALIMCLAGRCMPRHYIGRARDTPFGDRFAVDGERMKLTQIKQKKSKFSKEIIVVRLSHLLLFCNRCTLLPKISEAARAAARKGQDCGNGWAILISECDVLDDIFLSLLLRCYRQAGALLIVRCVVALIINYVFQFFFEHDDHKLYFL